MRVGRVPAGHALDRRFQVIEATLLNQRDQLAAEAGRPRGFVNHEAAPGLLHRLLDRRDIQGDERAQVDHLGIETAFLDSGPDHWSALHEINLGHVLHCCRAFVPGMVAAGAGSVVNVASVEAIRGYPPDPVYGAYKAAVAHFTKCFAMEVAPRGVRVNAIAPDVTQTIQVDYEKTVPEELRDRWPIWVPVGRVGDPKEMAYLVHS